MRPLNIAKSLIRYALTKTGPIAHPGIQAVSFIKSRPDIVAPDIQIHFIMVMYGEHGMEMHKSHGVQPLINVCVRKAWHRAVTSANPKDTGASIPIICRSQGRSCVICGTASKSAGTSSARRPSIRTVERSSRPGPDVKSDAQIDEYIPHEARPSYHPVGTCKMGPDPGRGRQQLRVHGVEGLRVVDASVMPSMVSANTNAAVIMIAEKGSDLILGRSHDSAARAA